MTQLKQLYVDVLIREKKKWDLSEDLIEIVGNTGSDQEG
jgi:hypothetical protein